MLCNQLYKQSDISGVLQFFRVYSEICSRPSQSAFSYFYLILRMQDSQHTYNLHFLSALPSVLRARQYLTSLEPKGSKFETKINIYTHTYTYIFINLCCEQIFSLTILKYIASSTLNIIHSLKQCNSLSWMIAVRMILIQ